MQYLHQNNVLHGDLTCGQCFASVAAAFMSWHSRRRWDPACRRKANCWAMPAAHPAAAHLLRRQRAAGGRAPRLPARQAQLQRQGGGKEFFKNNAASQQLCAANSVLLRTVRPHPALLPAADK